MSIFSDALKSYQDNRFQANQKKAEQLDNLLERILFWKKCLKEAKQKQGFNKKYRNQIKAEIAYLEEKMELSKRETQKSKNDSDNSTKENESKSYPLIDEFVTLFCEDTKYSKNAVRTYLIEWQKRENISSQRAKSKKAAIEKCPKLKNPAEGTFINWEEKWTEFRKSRTGK